MNPSTPHRALITGASSGIGRATAIAFAKSGFDVALVSRSLEKLQAVVAELADTGIKAKAYAVDLADVDHVSAEIHQVLADFGTVDVLVNCAGMGYTGSLATMSLADWQQVIGLNLTSIFQCIQAVLPDMRQQHRGTIVNIASIAGKSAFPDWGAYSVSKAGLMSLSRVLAVEERAHGIRVVTVSPGAVNTAIWDTATVQADFDRSRMLTPEVVAQTILNTVVLPEYAVIEDLTLMPSGGAF
ncbi:SDR family oxidoreductase [Pseudanabaena sp. FACHB-2040]|uniref:SDR family oxidoreductase n=1 Tax=Pseudanabaena sp. FACHB-2040 TaxID=2692859 RepID=UPI001687BECB|nr:SDR family oxidoreductase [Pseudanabaena sp. FACHB-2040]MBD0268835.1 SDR family oxidoreductase [Cyanobacteria bacterium Co-bin8]MBD2257785.1 SDR family oxidoreductase [Pseudanabaena sp. FACHB-2040]